MEASHTKKIWIAALQAFPASYALTVQMSVPLRAEWYEESVDYFTAQVASLLGEYFFAEVLLVPLLAVSFYVLQRCLGERKGGWTLPAFLAICVYLGRSYEELGNFGFCFGSIVNFLKLLAAASGMTILLRYLLRAGGRSFGIFPAADGAAGQHVFSLTGIRFGGFFYFCSVLIFRL